MLDQFPGIGDGGFALVAVIQDLELQLAAVDTALAVGLFERGQDAEAHVVASSRELPLSAADWPKTIES